MSQTITVNVLTSVSTGPSTGYFVIDGDFTSLFYPGFPFILFNGTEELPYVTVSSVLSAGNTQVTVNSPVYGSIVAIGAFVPGTGPFVSGTYTPVPVTGGHGSNAQLKVVVVGPGPAYSLGPITPGSGYNNGTYTAVPLTSGIIESTGNLTQPTGGVVTNGTYTSIALTGGAGSGALATIVVAGGIVTSVTVTTEGSDYLVNDILTYAGVGVGTGGTIQVLTVAGGALATVVVSGGFVAQVIITSPGINYDVNDILSTSNVNLGGFGSGFSVPVAAVVGSISSVTLVNAGVGYQAGDTLTFGGLGYGTGSTVPVVTVTTTETGTIELQNTQPMFIVGQQVFVISAGNASCQTPWWSMLPTTSPIPAVQPGTVLAIDVNYTNGTPSPTITYQIRLGSQPGVVSLMQNVVFVDLPTAIAAYQAQLA